MNKPTSNNAAAASSPSSPTSLNPNQLAELERLLATLTPATFAQLATAGRWQPARHLLYLDRALVDSIEAAVRGEQDGLLVSMPPQHGKSELCSKFLPAWYLGVHPDRRVILTSYEADFAATWGRRARDLLQHSAHLFGVRVSPKSSAANRWDIERHGGGMMTAGAGGPITGKGAHLLIVDDPIKNDQQARSASCRQQQWEWWQSVATTRLRPGGLIIVIQTRWHRDDLTGRILEQAGHTGQRWRHIKFPALAEEQDLLGRQPGEPLWPEMYPAQKLRQLKAARTPYYWQSLYQQNPQAEGSAEWPPSYFGPHIWFEHWPRESILRTVALDPSKGADARFGDDSAFALLAIDHQGILYVDADLALRNIALIVDTALEIQRTFQPDAFCVEVNQFQQLLADELNRASREHHLLLPLYEIDNRLNKRVRIRRLTPYLAQQRLRFKADSPSARLLVEQLRDFPHADHDDGPDALEMAIRLAEQLLASPTQEIITGHIASPTPDHDPYPW